MLKIMWYFIVYWYLSIFLHLVPLKTFAQVAQGCCIFWPVFECWALQMLVEICLFNVFMQKAEKAWKLRQNLAETVFFILHSKAGWGIYFKKKLWIHVFLVIKPSTSVWVQTLKTHFYLLLLQLFYFFFSFKLLCTKHLKSRFWSAFGVFSTQTLVEKYNIKAPFLLFFWM